jgi:hypothetical protein
MVRKLPKDPNQLAHYVLQATIGESEKIEAPVKDSEMQALSKLGASLGGQARAQRLSPSRRKSIAKKAAILRLNA